ncbi:hypothetical protein OG381_34485 [Streptomyces sp. NBC_00490]|uniref:hypothetical protein n=1 Tax=Streptomyces sp. NBC_00490 TaxID=2903657 RepID=UPI002E174417
MSDSTKIEDKGTRAVTVEQLTDVELTAGQYATLMRLTEPNDYQTERMHNLRTVLESAMELRSGKYATELTDEMIESVSYVLKVSALRGGAAVMQSNRFETEYALKGLTPRERLFKAREAGAEIRETRTNTSVTFGPQGDDDGTPWVVFSAGLGQYFRLPDSDVHPVWGE